MVFEAKFLLPDGKILEIFLFADEGGRLSFVEVDYDGNNVPVPDMAEIDAAPFLTQISKDPLTQ